MSFNEKQKETPKLIFKTWNYIFTSKCFGFAGSLCCFSLPSLSFSLHLSVSAYSAVWKMSTFQYSCFYLASHSHSEAIVLSEKRQTNTWKDRGSSEREEDRGSLHQRMDLLRLSSSKLTAEYNIIIIMMANIIEIASFVTIQANCSVFWTQTNAKWQRFEKKKKKKKLYCLYFFHQSWWSCWCETSQPLYVESQLKWFTWWLEVGLK